MKRWTLALALVLALPACTQAASEASTYELAEFTIDGPSDLGASVSTLTVTNTGEFPHTLVIAEADGSVVTATDMIQPGEAVVIDVDLGSGSYQFTCRIVGQKPDGTIVDHYEEGMVRTVSVGS